MSIGRKGRLCMRGFERKKRFAKFAAIAALAIICLFTVSCGKDPKEPAGTPSVTGPGQGTPGSEMTPGGTVTPDVSGEPKPATSTPTPTPSAENAKVLTWYVPFFNGPDEEARTEINRRLQEKGIDCVINFVNADVLTDKEYENWLSKLESKSKAPDIVSTGNWYTQRDAAVFATKHFYNLDEVLSTEAGKALKSALSESEWSRVRLPGGTYVLPRIWDSTAGDLGVYLRVKDADAAAFANCDGTYASIRSICDKLAANASGAVLSIPHSRFRVVAALAGYTTYEGMPVDPKTGEVLQWNNCEAISALYDTLYKDIRAGKVLDASLTNASKDATVIAEVYCGLREKKAGYTDICLAADLGEPVLNGCYGIGKDSAKKELAVKVLGACLTDPELVALLFPRMETAETVKTYRSLMAEKKSGALAGWIPELTDAQWNTVRELKDGIAALENAVYTANYQGAYLADEFAAKTWTEGFTDDKYKNVIKELNEHLSKLAAKAGEGKS